MNKHNTGTIRSAVAYAHQGETYRLLGFFEEAGEAFDKAINENSEYAWAYAHRGAALSQMGDSENALTDFDKAIDLYDHQKFQSAWAYAHRGDVYRLKYIRERHKSHFDPAATTPPPEDRRTHSAYRDLYEGKKTIDEIRTVVGNSEFLADDFSRAICDFTQATQLSGGVYAWAYAHRAATWRLKLPELGQTHQHWSIYHQWAKADLDKAIEQNDTYAWAYALRSTINKLMGNNSEAFEDLLTAVRIDLNVVKNPEAEYSVLLLYDKNYEQAIRYAETALKNNPNDTWAVYCLAVAKAGADKRKAAKARVEFDFAHSVLQESVSSNLCSLAGLAALEGDDDRANYFLCQAVQIDRAYAVDRARNDIVLRKLKFDAEKDCEK